MSIDNVHGRILRAQRNGGAPSFVNAEIIDTWHSTGLAGSGSNDYRAKDLFVPNAHTIAHGERSMRRLRSWRRRCTSSLPHRCLFVSARVSPDTRRAMALSLTHSFRAAREVAQSMYDLAGPTAVFAAKSPFDRLLRDAITMSEHLLISDSFLEMVGTGIVGDPPQIGWLWRRPVRLKPDTTSVPPAVRP